MKQTPTWKTETRTLAELKPLEKNPFGKVTAEKLDKLKGKLETLGVFEIPTLDQDNNLLTFNKRYHALMLLHGDSYQIDCRIPERDLTEKERKEIIVTSNVHEGSWDLGILDIEYADIDLGDLGLSTTEIKFEESAVYGKTLETFVNKDSVINDNCDIVDKVINGFKMSHVLISFKPETLIHIQDSLQQIKNTMGVEYEQGSN